MPKVREDDGLTAGPMAGPEARSKAPWLVAAEAARHTRKPLTMQVHLDPDTKRRVELAALVEGLDYSLVITGLIRSNLVGYYAGLRGGKDEAA